jgi:2-polyprenyl-3-methyl-5-hydroxy-6-metoxy-1,4-benzoquinol methylase/ribosomal protein S27E
MYAVRSTHPNWLTVFANFAYTETVIRNRPPKRGVDNMKEENIRPDYLMHENAKLHAEDIQQLLARRNEFVEIACPACESNSYQVVFEKDGFTFVTCTECETIFINPRPTFEMLAEFYATSKSIKHWNDKIFPISEDSRRSQIFAPRAERVVKLCRKHNVATKVLLDVGAGFGTFCEEIKKRAVFDKVIAVEPSHDLAETCRRKGLDVIEKPIEEVNLDDVSVITNFELIEHLYSPKDFLLACGRALPRGGLLILTTPNIKGFDLLVLGKLSNNIGGPNHLNYFHPKSLRYLLRRCGFEVIEVMTPGKLDAELVRKKILSNELDVSSHPFLKYVLIDQWEVTGEAFQRFLADNGLSSHLWMVARKI